MLLFPGDLGVAMGYILRHVIGCFPDYRKSPDDGIDGLLVAGELLESHAVHIVFNGRN